MKQVKVLIADAFRPVLVKLQPLCFSGQGRPIIPPPPPYFGFSEKVWATTSRSWALEKVGKPYLAQVSSAEGIRWCRSIDKIILAVCPDNEDLIGHVIEAVDGKPTHAMGDRELANWLVNSPGVVLSLQIYAATGAKPCIYCDERGWNVAKFCWNCGKSTH